MRPFHFKKDSLMKKKSTMDILKCIPIRQFKWEKDKENGKIIIIRPKFISNSWQNFFDPILKTKHFKIKLDDLGSACWAEMDGNNTIEEIGKILAEKFGDSIEPIYERLIKFTLQLQREKFIRFLCPEDE